MNDYEFLHLSIDTFDDFTIVEVLINHFHDNPNYTFSDVVKYLSTNRLGQYNVNDDKKHTIDITKGTYDTFPIHRVYALDLSE